MKRRMEKLQIQLENERKINFSLAKRISLVDDQLDGQSKINYRDVYDFHSNSVDKHKSDLLFTLNKQKNKISKCETEVGIYNIKDMKTFKFRENDNINEIPFTTQAYSSSKFKRNKSENPIKGNQNLACKF